MSCKPTQKFLKDHFNSNYNSNKLTSIKIWDIWPVNNNGWRRWTLLKYSALFCVKWKDLSLTMPWETLQTTCGRMEINFHVSLKMMAELKQHSVAYDNYWRTSTTPHHAFTNKPKNMLLHISSSSNLKTRN